MKGGDVLFGAVCVVIIAVAIYYVVTVLAVTAILALLLPGAAVYGGVLGWAYVWDQEGSKERWERKAKAAATLCEAGSLLLAGVAYLLGRAVGGPAGGDAVLRAIAQGGVVSLCAVFVTAVILIFLAGYLWVGYSLGSGLAYYLEKLLGREPQRTLLPVVKFRASERGHRMGFIGAAATLITALYFLFRIINRSVPDGMGFWEEMFYFFLIGDALLAFPVSATDLGARPEKEG